MQVVKSIIAFQALLLPAVLAVGIGGWCDPNVNKQYTSCDDTRTTIMYCDGGDWKWKYAYGCGQGCCYNAAPPGSGNGGSYAHCKC